MSAAEQSPTDLDALARAMMGTEDGGMLDGNEEIPIGECYRLAAEWFTDGQYKSPSEVAELVNAAHDEGRNEVIRWGWSSADALIAIAYKSPSEVAELVHAAQEKAWAKADLAYHPLVFAVESFIDNGGDPFGNLDGALDTVQSIRNPYRRTDTPEAEQ